MAGLDISMPGDSLIPSYCFHAYYGDLLVEGVDNGSVPFSRVEDMAKRLWHPMIEFGVIDEPVIGSEEGGSENSRTSTGADNELGLSLPGDEDAMIARLAKLSKKTLVILNTNSAVLMPWLNDVDAVMEAWYSGQQVGLAIGNFLFGEVNLSGKIPMTFPKTLNDTIRIWQELDTKFVEGYNETSSIIVSTILTNTGTLAGKQVVQLYVSYPDIAKESPKLLKGFENVYLEAGQESEIPFLVGNKDLNIWDEKMEDWAFVHGQYKFKVGFPAGDVISEETICL